MKRLKTMRWFAAVLLVLATCCLGLMSLYFAAGGSGTVCRAYLRQPTLIVLNLLPFVLIGILFWTITNRCWLAFLLDGVICLVYSFAAYWKWDGRSDALYAEDVANFREGLQMGGQGYVNITWQVALAIAAVAAGTLVFLLLFRGKKRCKAAENDAVKQAAERDSGKVPTNRCGKKRQNTAADVRLGDRLSCGIRGSLAAGVLLIGVALYLGVYTNDTLYEKFPVAPGRSQWSAADQFVSRGGMYPFLHSIKAETPTPPEGYSKQEAQAALAAYAEDEIGEGQKVHVVMTMLEAFCDLSDYTDAITGADPYAAYHALQAESYTGQLFTNIFAGGTINTERCVLTGFSKLQNFRRASWSYARYFASQGYTCTGSHPGNAAFYNRSNVNRNLGFTDYWFLNNYYEERFGGIARDAELLPEIASIAEQQMAEGDWVFSFNVTYQNHGPYFDDRLTGDTIYVPQGTLSDSDYHIINNYLTGAADTGAQMRAFCDRFRDSEEPVVIVFFGDHKPWLGEQSVTYAALGIDLDAPGETGAAATYLTDYLIWANDAAKKTLGKPFCGEGPTISPCFLMNVLFAQCGWEGPAYQKLTDAVMERTPVVSTHDWYGTLGTLGGWETLDDAAQTAIEQMQRVQYYLAREEERAAQGKNS